MTLLLLLAGFAAAQETCAEISASFIGKNARIVPTAEVQNVGPVLKTRFSLEIDKERTVIVDDLNERERIYLGCLVAACITNKDMKKGDREPFSRFNDSCLATLDATASNLAACPAAEPCPECPEATPCESVQEPQATDPPEEEKRDWKSIIVRRGQATCAGKPCEELFVECGQQSPKDGKGWHIFCSYATGKCDINPNNVWRGGSSAKYTAEQHCTVRMQATPNWDPAGK